MDFYRFVVGCETGSYIPVVEEAECYVAGCFLSCNLNRQVVEEGAEVVPESNFLDLPHWDVLDA